MCPYLPRGLFTALSRARVFFCRGLLKITDRLTVLIFLASRKQAGEGEPLSLPPELSWNLETDRRSV